MKRRKLKKWVKVMILVVVISFIMIDTDKTTITKKSKQKQNTIEKKRIYTKEIIDIPQQVKQEVKKQEEKKVEQKKEEVKQEVQTQSSYTTRMTSYYPEEGELTTGSGLSPANFEINDKGWYTYQGKLVVATATTYLANQGWQVGSGVHLRKYYNELTLNIDGVDYQAIVLDSCGNCMRTDRIDLYVSSVDYLKDTMIEVKE